uniref:CWH43-like N-terminal domain-containing protein n=1 Tax=Globisporangium ultimum (strain ATCC 200006 / CBS 805.95 / DAOM BR144) TaxID=431595 RepID=K3X8A3_GLOUD
MPSLSPALVMRARMAAPLVASGTVVVTLVTCLVLTKSRHIYTGGLHWPYFSDMGRDSPGYYIFCVGLTVTALALAYTWVSNFEFQRAVLGRPILLGQVTRATLRWASACMVLGAVSTIGLPVLAFFSTSSYPTVHNYAAYWFFFLETVAVFINTTVSSKIYRSMRTTRDSGVFTNNGLPADPGMPADDAHAARVASVWRTFLIQAVFTALFFVAFLLYLPIGLAVVKDFEHLTIADCLERGYGEKYCTDTMRKNDTETKLWNYEDDFSASQMRAAAQLGCILTLVGYSVSFLSHDFAREVDKPRDTTRNQVPSTHFYTIPVLNSPSSE